VTLALLGTGALSAQTRPGAISGVVRDSAGQPIPFVEITAVKTGRAVRADSTGHFLLAGLPSANTDVSFRRLAYAPVILMILVPPADTTDVEVTLGVSAQQLTGMIVQERPQQLRTLVAFENRRAHGVGKFITRAQIEEHRPMRLSEMLRTVPGIMVIPADNGRPAVRFTRGASNRCNPQMIVDGMEAQNFSIDDMPPSDVEGIELYAGAAGLPPEYSRLFSTSNCGTVIIWSRIPGFKAAKP
jgi:hypothetical protein